MRVRNRQCLCQFRQAGTGHADYASCYVAKESRKLRIRIFITLLLLFLYISCDDVNECDGYDYIASSFIDTIMLGDTISNGQDVTLVYFYPAGCNSFKRINCTEESDTLRLEALFRFLFKCMPCAHGSGLDTIQYSLSANRSGQFVVNYRKNETAIRNMSVFIK